MLYLRCLDLGNCLEYPPWLNVLVFNCGLSAEEACDETWSPLLDQGLVEVSGSFVLLTFASEKVRPDSSS